MSSFLRQRFGGFTLIDTAMGLMVLGLLIAGAAAAFKLHVRDAQIKTTYANSQLVARAMENFIHQNASFPCPAAVNLTPDNPMYGVSANCAALTGYDAAGNPGPVVGPGGFAGGIFVEEGTIDSTRRIVRGMIPFKTLNLPESFAYDGHKQRLFYALSADQANEVTFAADAGAIAVVGADGALGPTATQKTHFLIFSAGRDGRGAYAKSGAQILPCGAGLDAENCNTATGPNAKAIYRTAAAANTDGTATNFDDYFLPDNSIIIPLWKEDPSNDGNIHDIKGQKIVVGGDPADPKTAAILDVKIDVMGAARARVDELGAKGIGDSKGNALADDYCDENKGACFGAELIAGNELAMDCNTAFGARPAGPAMTGIGDAEAKCGPLAFNFACPAGMALTGVGAGGAPICSYICAPDTESQFYTCPAPHTTGRVEERRDMDCTLSPPNWGPWMYYDDDCCTPTSQTEPNAPCPAGYAGTYSRTRDYTCPAAAWGAWVPAALPAPPSCILIVNGVCGSADGQRLATQPSGGALCSAGADTAVSGGATGPVWTWDCNGTPAGFGTTDNCSATYGVDGVCGPDSGPTTATAPTDPGLCTAGTPTAVTYTGSGWNWTCNGLGAGAPSPGCSAPETLVNGTCGTANGNAFASAPSGGTLCNTGSVAAAPSGAGPWNWTCNGSGGGGSQNCTAVPTVTPSCGGTVDYTYQITLANELNDDTVTCPSTHRSIPIYGSPLVGTLPVVRPLAVSSFCVADAACSGGGSCTLSGSSTPTDADVISDCASSLGYTQGSDFAYAFVIERSPGDYVVCHNNSSIMGLACAGSYGGEFWWDAMPPCAGAFPACPAGGTINGTCGAANSQLTTSQPTLSAELCATGTPTAVSGSGPWSWTCEGSGAGHSDGICATDACPTDFDYEQRVRYCPTPTLDTVTATCPPGTYPDRQILPPATHWCTTDTRFDANCLTLPGYCTGGPVAGTCGTASGNSFASAPSSNLCGAGNGVATPAPSGAGPWNWTCGGSGGGAPSLNCTASSSAAGCVTGNIILAMPGRVRSDTDGGVTASTGFGMVTHDGDNCSATANISANGDSKTVTATGTFVAGSNDCWATTNDVVGGVPVTVEVDITSTGAYGDFHDLYGAATVTPHCSGAGPVNGTCGGTVGTCSSGTPIADNGLSACGTTRSWTCDGSGVGHTDATCNVPNPACTSACTNGSSLVGWAVQHTCSGGTIVDNDASMSSLSTYAALPGYCARYSGNVSLSHGGPAIRVWRDATMTFDGALPINVRACDIPVPAVINGACGPDSGTATTTAPTDPGLCASGTPSAVSGSGPFTWSCNGSGTGHTDDNTCSAPLAGGIGDCNALMRGPEATQIYTHHRPLGAFPSGTFDIAQIRAYINAGVALMPIGTPDYDAVNWTYNAGFCDASHSGGLINCHIPVDTSNPTNWFVTQRHSGYECISLF